VKVVSVMIDLQCVVTALIRDYVLSATGSGVMACRKAGLSNDNAKADS